MGEAKGQYVFEETKEGTKLTWTFNGESGWPMNLMNFMATRAIGKSFTEGLKNLEPIFNERNAGNYGGFAVKEIVVPERHYVMNRSEVKFENISQFYAQNLGSLFQKIQKAGLEMNGMPCGLFFKYDIPNGVTDMAAAIPLKESVDIPDASSYHIDERNALSIDFYGDYAGTGAAHDAIEAYMKDRGLLNDVPVVEEYVTDPASEPDPKKWLTKIYYFVSE
jgi:effector-binding domain-containing protein